MKKLLCLLGIHEWKNNMEAIGIYDKSNLYAQMGSLRAGIKRNCISCKKEEVCGIRNDSPTLKWVKVIDYIAKKKEICTSKTTDYICNAIIAEGTPIVNYLP